MRSAPVSLDLPAGERSMDQQRLTGAWSIQAGVDAAEVVNHHRRWDVGDPWPQVGQRRASKVKFDEPAEAVDARMT